MERFCTWLQRQRKMRRLSPKALAVKSTLSIQTIYLWEHGAKVPSPTCLNLVLRALRVPYEQFRSEVDRDEWFRPEQFRRT